LPDHTTLLTSLGKGSLTYKKGNESKTFQISGGFCEVRQNSIIVLANEVVED
jgi:F0F1-type ATP synthase epsilon subunit